MSRAKKFPFNSDNLLSVMYFENVTQKALAESIGIAPAHLSRIFRDGEITENLLDKISKKLNIRPDFLTDPDWTYDYFGSRQSLTREAWEKEGCPKPYSYTLDDYLLITDSGHSLHAEYSKLAGRKKSRLIRILRMVIAYCVYDEDTVQPSLEDVVQMLQDFTAPEENDDVT